jgi:hypothetical protein
MGGESCLWSVLSIFSRQKKMFLCMSCFARFPRISIMKPEISQFTPREETYEKDLGVYSAAFSTAGFRSQRLILRNR